MKDRVEPGDLVGAIDEMIAANGLSVDEVFRGVLARRIRTGDLALVVLDLPEPPSQTGPKSWRASASKTMKTKRRTWAAAVAQVRPFREPPKLVRIHAHFRLFNPRDEWNLPYDLKPVVDALQRDVRKQDEEAWRSGLFLDRGYYVSDAGARRGLITQEVDRSNRGVTLVIEPLEPWTRGGP